MARIAIVKCKTRGKRLETIENIVQQKMTNSFIENFACRLTDVGLVSANNSVVGITEPEIAQIEKKFQVRLPEIYRKYLLKMGKSSGEFNRGSDFFYPEILDLRSDAEDLLAERFQDFQISQNSFVFGMHQGYQFWYFDTTDGDNPPIYYYLEGEGSPSVKFPTFVALLEAMFDDHVEIMRRLKSR